MLLFGVSPLRAQHGGGGGHSFGGFSGHSSGHSGGHSIGHSFGHFLGHRSGGHGKGTSSLKESSEVPPLAGAAMIHGKVVQLPNPAEPQGVLIPGRHKFHHPPPMDFAPGRRFGGFPFGQNSEFAFCGTFGGFHDRRFFGGDFDCFRQGFFFDPFFIAGFFPDAFMPEESGGSFGDTEMYDAGEMNPATTAGNGAEDSTPASSPSLPGDSANRQPDTLLQLIDGSMYGLKDYWLEGNRLHYITNYGGENSVPLERIDFGKTQELNADQGTRFEIRPKSATDQH
jgi:hypothetical protein